MRNKKTVIRLLTALALLAITALLPFLTAFCQDLATLGSPALGSIQAVELDFSKGTPGLALLALMDQANESRWQIIDPAAASMTQEEAEGSARDALAPYQEAGLIPASQSFTLHMVEARATSAPSGLAGVMWMFTFVSEEKGSFASEVHLAMDDASGRITNFSFSCNDRIPAQGMAEKLRAFASVYFEQLGIPDHEQAEVDDLENTYIGDTAVGQRYRFGDTQYGETCVDLYMYQYGFFTDFNG